MILKDQTMRAKVLGYLHAEGYTVPQIAGEFEVSRQAVHKTLSALPDYDEIRLRHNLAKAQQDYAKHQQERVSESA